MKKKILIIVLGGVLISLIFPGETQAQQKIIKMGITAALQKEAGIGSKNASEMAAQEINAAHFKSLGLSIN